MLTTESCIDDIVTDMMIKVSSPNTLYTVLADRINILLKWHWLANQTFHMLGVVVNVN